MSASGKPGPSEKKPFGKEGSYKASKLKEVISNTVKEYGDAKDGDERLPTAGEGKDCKV